MERVSENFDIVLCMYRLNDETWGKNIRYASTQYKTQLLVHECRIKRGTDSRMADEIHFLKHGKLIPYGNIHN